MEIFFRMSKFAPSTPTEKNAKDFLLAFLDLRGDCLPFVCRFTVGNQEDPRAVIVHCVLLVEFLAFVDGVGRLQDRLPIGVSPFASRVGGANSRAVVKGQIVCPVPPNVMTEISTQL